MPRGIYDRSKANRKPRAKAPRAKAFNADSTSSLLAWYRGWLEGFDAAGKIWRGAMRKA